MLALSSSALTSGANKAWSKANELGVAADRVTYREGDRLYAADDKANELSVAAGRACRRRPPA